MPRPLKEYVQQVLAEHGRGEKMRLAFEYANRKVKAQPDHGKWRRKSTRRAFFWECAVDKLIELTADDPGLFIDHQHDTVSFVFDDAVLVRLKKANLALRTSNYPTELAQLFHDAQVDLFGYTGLQRVEAVYIPDQFETKILWSGVVCRDSDWHFEFLEPTLIPVVSLPQPEATPTANLAKLKDDVKDRKKTDNNNEKKK